MLQRHKFGQIVMASLRHATYENCEHGENSYRADFNSTYSIGMDTSETKFIHTWKQGRLGTSFILIVASSDTAVRAPEAANRFSLIFFPGMPVHCPVDNVHCPTKALHFLRDS